jgi:predicted DCC family thiol-disulfide oxidoreductase YuxK
MQNGWTGGQYSIVRAVFGGYLFVHFIAAAIAGVAMPLNVLAAVASIFFAIGLYDRLAAVVICSVLAFVFARSPLIDNWSLPFAGCVLLIHVLLPPAPYGSWAARGRIDPRGSWSFPPALFATLWIVMLLFWLAMLFMLLGLLVPIGFADLGFMVVILHLFAFDPAWIPRRALATTDVLLYDGSCGLCHRSVRLVLAEDASGTAFTFSPLPGSDQASVIVQTADGRTLTKSDAVIHILHRLGGLWRVIAVVFGLVPRTVRDVGYDFVARVRYRIFGRTKNACPLLPPDLRSRFH